ncbi:unnamed protein product [Sphacelaria rigidula]
MTFVVRFAKALGSIMNRAILFGGICFSFAALQAGADWSKGLCWSLAVFAFMWSITNTL